MCTVVPHSPWPWEERSVSDEAFLMVPHSFSIPCPCLLHLSSDFTPPCSTCSSLGRARALCKSQGSGTCSLCGWARCGAALGIGCMVAPPRWS